MAKQGAGRSRKPLCTTTVQRVMQMAIAEGLKKWYEPPQELSEELARLLGTSESDRLSQGASQRSRRPSHVESRPVQEDDR